MQINTNADMSHQNTIYFKLKLFLDSLKSNGVKLTINKIYQRVNYKIKGIDFSTQNLHNLTLIGEHKTNGTALVSTSRDFFYKVFFDLDKILNKKIPKEIFIDFGSGKGAALIHASSIGFKKAIGVEFAKELHDIALRNIKKLNIQNVYSFYQDATTFKLPNETTIIYFFNPFDKTVMKKVIKNIQNQKETFLHDVYIIYVRPVCNDIVQKHFTLIKSIKHSSGAIVNYYKI